MKKPTKFVGLHNHTTFSSMDGLGYPDDHFKWCIENGLTAHALTEHGSMNSFSLATLWIYEYNKNNPDKKFKFIPGIEAYFHPNLKDWAREKTEIDSIPKEKKTRKKRDEDAAIDAPPIEYETNNQLVIENEDESKSSTKHYNPINRRHHLVLLAKNSAGLKKLFWLTSMSYMNGFYRFPRIDIEMMNKAEIRGDVIASTACVGGLLSWLLYRIFPDTSFDHLYHDLLDDPSSMSKALEAVKEGYELLLQAIDKDDLYLELQFNKLPAQHLTNRALIEFAKANNLTDKLIVTCDAHYYRPELWREREMYKKLGYLNYAEYGPNSLPKSKDDLKAELYPKNADQVWESYLEIKEQCDFYDDDMICDAIERTYEIAYEKIGDPQIDKSVKLSSKDVPAGVTPIDHLRSLATIGLKKRGFAGNAIYEARLVEELSVINTLNVAEYFTSLQRMLELARNVTLLGPGRGCFVPETRVKLWNDSYVSIDAIKIGDEVIDAFGNKQIVENIYQYDIDEEIIELLFENNKHIMCTRDHKFLTKNRGWVEAQHLVDDDDIVEI